jgi:sarcosine oxidase subunit delta
VREFSYLGDATVKRPDPLAKEATSAFVEYVYYRDNPAGVHHEYWYHAAGCQCWLTVTRDTNTHEFPGAKAPVAAKS